MVTHLTSSVAVQRCVWIDDEDDDDDDDDEYNDDKDNDKNVDGCGSKN